MKRIIAIIYLTACIARIGFSQNIVKKSVAFENNELRTEIVTIENYYQQDWVHITNKTIDTLIIEYGVNYEIVNYQKKAYYTYAVTLAPGETIGDYPLSHHADFHKIYETDCKARFKLLDCKKNGE